MARGLSQPMAISTRASDSPGSRARSVRARPAAPRAERLKRPWEETALMSSGLQEGGLNYPFLGQFVPTEIGDDATVLEDVDMVAIVELLGLGRIPDEGAAVIRLLAYEVVDLELGADVDAAHWIVHQDYLRI